MLSTALLGELRCPHFGGGLQLENLLQCSEAAIEHGVVRCPCYRYPIIECIVLLRRFSGVSDTVDVRARQLLVGEVDAARASAMQTGVPVPTAVAEPNGLANRLRHRVLGRSESPAKSDTPGVSASGGSLAETIARRRPGLYGQYQRCANNSFHASVPLLLLPGDMETRQPAPRVLELTCGIGHFAFLMGATFPHLEVVATDFEFTNLLIARRHFAPNAQFVCIDAEAPLPFSSGSFAAVSCLDGFHFVRSKVALGGEALRVGADDALFLFPTPAQSTAAQHPCGHSAGAGGLRATSAASRTCPAGSTTRRWSCATSPTTAAWISTRWNRRRSSNRLRAWPWWPPVVPTTGAGATISSTHFAPSHAS